MKTDDFDFELDESKIAQYPIEKRDHSKLLIMDRMTGELKDEVFYNIIHYLRPDDLLIVNNTRVMPARLFGHRPMNDESIETLLLKRKKDNIWECLVRPGKKMRIGQEIYYSDRLRGKVIEINDDGIRRIEFFYNGIFEEILDEIGNMPLPPYIKKSLLDNERYQTIFSKHWGSAAAPTAGLHFTDTLLARLKKKGVQIANVTLHVGLGTFRPVNVEDVTNHTMHSEYYEISLETCDKIKETKNKNGRIIAVGTTSIRTLETVANKYPNELQADKGTTDIFIYPGYKFKIVDSLITNFHLPKSTLMMLVSAFSSKEKILSAYQYAIEKDYRFFSFGDAMFIQ